MLGQLDLEFGLNKVDYAIKIIRDNEPPEGYYLAFSGGKDSVVLYDLAVKSGVKFDAHYCVSPIDPPQVQKFIKQNYPDVIWDYHAKGWWSIVVKEGLPIRQQRWCCRIIKEVGGENRFVLVGVRGSESSKRTRLNIVEKLKNLKANKVVIRPILLFTLNDVWDYIGQNKLPYCELYDMGFKRIGCVLCPFSNEIEREEKYFPKIVNCWKLACNRIVDRWKSQGYITKKGRIMKRHFETGEELYKWWTSRK